MSDDSLNSALAKVLDDYDARRRGEQEREQKARDQETSFLAEFAELRREVIRPVFEQAAQLLEGRGHRCSVNEQEFAPAGAARSGEAMISLRVAPAGTRAPLHEDQRSLAITTRHYNRTVWINSGESPTSGGLAGSKGAYPLEKVTRQLVEDEVVAFVARAMA